MLVNKEIAYRLESCIKQSHIEVTNTYAKGKVLDIAGGAACFSGLDSFLSQVVGWGFSTKLKHLKRELGLIEQFYASLGNQRVDIELCPFVGKDLAVFLGQHGYNISEWSNVSVLDLHQYRQSAADVNYLIKQVIPNDFDLWANRVAIAFGYPEAQEQFSHYIRAKGVHPFAAYDQDELIAGATVAIHGSICDLGVTSTCLPYRNKGLQKALLNARLNFARKLGAEMATVTTDPGSISDLNVQKSGFKCAYTRIKMTLSFN